MSRIKYTYLMSAAHSGSTLLSCILGCHSEIATVGELGSKVNPEDLCSCGTKYKACEFWRHLTNLYRERYDEDLRVGNLKINLGMSENPSLLYEIYYYISNYRLFNNIKEIIFSLLTSYPKRSQAATEKRIRIVQLILEIFEKKYFFDIAKNSLQVRFLANLPNVDLKYLILVRDGRAVTCSIMKNQNKTIKEAVDSWLWSNRYIQKVCKFYIPRSRVLFIKFEDLCNYPSETLKRILDFMEVSNDIIIKPIKESKLHIIGNRMRLKFDGKIKRPDESWRKNLSVDDLKYFNKKAGWLNRKLGYM